MPRRAAAGAARIAASLLFCSLSTAHAAGPADAPALFAQAPAEVLVARVLVNSESKGDLFVGRTADLDFLVKVADLQSLGLKNLSGRTVLLEGEPHLSLRSMAGVKFTFDERTLSLNIMAEPALLPGSAYSLATRHARERAPAPPSAYFNYALNAVRNDPALGTRLGFAGEAGWRLGNFLVRTDGSTVWTTDQRRKFVRLQTSLAHDDLDNLRQTVVGDFFTPSRDISTSVNLGGISVSKVYSLDPYYVRLPTQSISGNVSLPSELEVYLDGHKIRTEHLRPGEFELRDISAFGGAQSVQLVLRDPFGRVQQLSYSFYFSDQPLQAGLHEYSYNLGAFRRAYGDESNRYGPAAFSLFHRYGLSSYATIGIRAEGTQQLRNAGPLLTLVGKAGVLNLAVVHSALAGRAGTATSLGYSYQARGWTLGMSLRHDGRHYAALADPPAKTNRRYEGSFGGSYQVGGNGTLSLTHSFLTVRSGIASLPAGGQPFSVTALTPRRATTLSYSAPLAAGRVSFTASISHVKDQVRGSRNEAFVGFTLLLDKNHSLSGTMRRDREAHAESLRLVKSQPIGEGVGYAIGTDGSSDPAGRTSIVSASLQYNAPAAVLRAEYSRSAGGQVLEDYRLGLAGNISFVGGETALGRPVTGSFGIAKVGEVADVEVLLEGQSMGRTDSRGKLFLPTLNPYFDNQVSINPGSVPIEYSIPALSKTVSPPLRGGVLVDFAVVRMQAFTGRLQRQAGGAIVPLEFRDGVLQVPGKAQRFQTGRAGEFYLENLRPGRYPGSVEVDGKRCAFEVGVPDSQETFVDLAPVTCHETP